MNDFVYSSPTNVHFGKNSMETLADLIKGQDGSNVLFIYGGNAIKKNGVYDKVVASLKAGGIDFIELSGVKPNPRISLIRSAIFLCKEKGIDFILAVGGGSVIDSAKGIAAGVKNEGDIWDYYIQKKPFLTALPIGAIVTLPAAGSETRGGSVVTNEENHLKRYTGGPGTVPKFAILNPEFTFSLPPYQTACGASDIMAHLFERYFTNTKNVDLTDRLLESTIKCVMNNVEIALHEPENYNARAEIMWAATLAHNDILGTGRLGDWGSHDVSHELSAFYDLAHGAALSIIFPAWMKHVYKVNPSKFIQFAVRVMNVDYAFESEEQIVLEMINRLEKFYNSIGLPIRLSEVGINDEKFEIMAASAMIGRQYLGNFIQLREKEIVNIYRLAL